MFEKDLAVPRGTQSPSISDPKGNQVVKGKTSNPLNSAFSGNEQIPRERGYMTKNLGASQPKTNVVKPKMELEKTPDNSFKNLLG